MLSHRMLEVLGISSHEELFKEIPDGARVKGLELPAALDERALITEISSILSRNRTMEDMPTFLGGGVYGHYIPAAVEEIVGRSEFLTSYTPYQPEASQGMLQAMFEYQSFLSELTGMDAVNSSMYDWSTALGEAALMCHRMRPGTTFLTARSVSPERKDVLGTYLRGIGAKVVEIPYRTNDGMLDIEALRPRLTEDVFGLYMENPNFFGVMEEGVDDIAGLIGELPLVVGCNPLSLAIMRPPAEYGADIVIGEGHHLGTPPNFGGPLLGIFGTKKEHIRKMPGRIIGATTDSGGKRAFCMTLQTREQHIRRDKATSNICTNEALMALAAGAYISVIGGAGLIDVANENLERAKSLRGMISEIDGYDSPIFDAHHFNEFVIRAPADITKMNGCLLEHGVHGGIPLRDNFPELGEAMLLTVSELHREEDLKALVSALGAIG